ncbi:hypothetical protein F0342_22705 [Bacillus sp. CH30_1T]|jgi:hypothetical protein|uniref:hypothetical protein n=1 Tax=Bacillus sp. CH30_1T TaxID=2604836 RepID=UPI0011ECA668|nr:hypothetical protein [Bacillus sp. CH30_1T]KAA0560430.1 hypothetical protein F0342_22705 [Bacillus sp. CH30_1T]
MDELKRLRGLMKEETFKGHGFTNKMRENILNEIHSKRPKSFTFNKKPVLAPLMSVLFVAACLSLFVYFGGTQLGLIDGNNASAPFYQYEAKDRPESLGDEFKFLTKAPFEVEKVTTETGEDPSGKIELVTLKGKERQTIKLTFQSIEAETNLTLSQDEVKVGQSKGSYYESEGPAKVSHLTWIEGDTIKYEMEYFPGGSDVTLSKKDMIKMAESFR